MVKFLKGYKPGLKSRYVKMNVCLSVSVLYALLLLQQSFCRHRMLGICEESPAKVSGIVHLSYYKVSVCLGVCVRKQTKNSISNKLLGYPFF